MAEITEKFNVEEVKNKMNTLETAFNALSDTLSEANKIVNEEVNVGPESALFGELGTILLNTWNENASTFGDFHANFESWAQVVSVIAANNMSFTEETIKAYKDDGSTLTYKDSATGTRLTISSLREMKGYEQSVNYIKGKFSDEKYDVTEGVDSLFVKDKEGNLVVEYIMENGKITSTKWYDSDGNYSVITYEVGEDGKLKKNVTYYDANGNVIEKPSSFYKDGTLRPDLTGSSVDEPTEVVTKTGNLSDLKDGDTVIIGTEECVVSEKNGVRTITLKNGEQIQIMSDGTVKTLYGGEVEINGQKIGSTAYTDEELRAYYTELNKNESSYRYKNAEGQNVDVIVRDDRTIFSTDLGNGDYVTEMHFKSNQIAKITVRGGAGTLTVVNEKGENLLITDKDARCWFNDSVTSVNYVGENGHNKVMTRDSSTGGYVVEDKENGNLSYYVIDDNGYFVSSGGTIENNATNNWLPAEHNGLSVYGINTDLAYSDNKDVALSTLYLSACSTRDSLNADNEKISKYLEKYENELSGDEELYDVLKLQLNLRQQISDEFSDEFKHHRKAGAMYGLQDGVYADISPSDPTYNTIVPFLSLPKGFSSGLASAYKSAIEASDRHNDQFKHVYTIDDLNNILIERGYSKIE